MFCFRNISFNSVQSQVLNTVTFLSLKGSNSFRPCWSLLSSSAQFSMAGPWELWVASESFQIASAVQRCWQPFVFFRIIFQETWYACGCGEHGPFERSSFSDVIVEDICRTWHFFGWFGYIYSKQEVKQASGKVTHLVLCFMELECFPAKSLFSGFRLAAPHRNWKRRDLAQAGGLDLQTSCPRWFWPHDLELESNNVDSLDSETTPIPHKQCCWNWLDVASNVSRCRAVLKTTHFYTWFCVRWFINLTLLKGFSGIF